MPGWRSSGGRPGWTSSVPLVEPRSVATADPWSTPEPGRISRWVEETSWFGLGTVTSWGWSPGAKRRASGARPDQHGPVDLGGRAVGEDQAGHRAGGHLGGLRLAGDAQGRRLLLRLADLGQPVVLGTGDDRDLAGLGGRGRAGRPGGDLGTENAGTLGSGGTVIPGTGAGVGIDACRPTGSGTGSTTGSATGSGRSGADCSGCASPQASEPTRTSPSRTGAGAPAPRCRAGWRPSWSPRRSDSSVQSRSPAVTSAGPARSARRRWHRRGPAPARRASGDRHQDELGRRLQAGREQRVEHGLEAGPLVDLGPELGGTCLLPAGQQERELRAEHGKPRPGRAGAVLHVVHGRAPSLVSRLSFCR